MVPLQLPAHGTLTSQAAEGAGRAGTPRRPVRGIAVSLAGNVLGAGMLLMPSVVEGTAGAASLRAWGVHLALGGAVTLLLAGIVAGACSNRLSGTLSVLLGPWAGRLVDAVYTVAFTFGQAAIAWLAAVCVLSVFSPLPLAPDLSGAALASGVLLVGTLLAVVRCGPPVSRVCGAVLAGVLVVFLVEVLRSLSTL